MKYTDTYQFKKPEDHEAVEINDINSNMDAIDAELYLQDGALSVHQTAPVLDHPDGSVTAEKIAVGAVTDDKISSDRLDGVELELPQKEDKSNRGVAGGYAELDANGNVPSSQLPSYVDDVLEYASLSVFPAVGESGKIYVALDTNKTYRWGGTSYVVISETISLGETSSTAYRGDRGKIAYDHSQVTGNPHGVTKADVGLGDVTNDAQVKRSEVVHTTGNSTTSVMSQKGVSDAISQAGGGDMLKSDYDTNNNMAADKADALTTARTIALSGDATGSASFDGSANVTIAVTVNEIQEVTF